MVRLALLCVLLSVLLGSPGVARGGEDDVAPVLPGPRALREVLADAGRTGRPALLVLHTAWCGWCGLMEETVFPDPVAKEALAAFVVERYDAEADPGAEVAARHRVQAFPTLLAVDAQGEEIDRLIGFLPPGELAQELARMRGDEGTLRALRRAHARAPRDPEAGLALARKLLRFDAQAAAVVLSALDPAAASCPAGIRVGIALARGEVALNQGDLEGALAHFEAATADETACRGEDAVRAGMLAASASQRAGQPLRGLVLLARVRDRVSGDEQRQLLESTAFRLHLAGAGAALEAWAAHAGGDPETLNEAAWAAYLHRIQVRAAVDWARRAAETSGGAPHVLDTLANLLFEEGELEEAVAAERRAHEGETDPAAKARFAETLAQFEAALAHRRAFDRLDPDEEDAD
jgi:thioredoxin-related protein